MHIHRVWRMEHRLFLSHVCVQVHVVFTKKNYYDCLRMTGNHAMHRQRQEIQRYSLGQSNIKCYLDLTMKIKCYLDLTMKNCLKFELNNLCKNKKLHNIYKKIKSSLQLSTITSTNSSTSSLGSRCSCSFSYYRCWCSRPQLNCKANGPTLSVFI
jgi:hypothetical protein